MKVLTLIIGLVSVCSVYAVTANADTGKPVKCHFQNKVTHEQGDLDYTDFNARLIDSKKKVLFELIDMDSMTGGTKTIATIASPCTPAELKETDLKGVGCMYHILAQTQVDTASTLQHLSVESENYLVECSPTSAK